MLMCKCLLYALTWIYPHARISNSFSSLPEYFLLPVLLLLISGTTVYPVAHVRTSATFVFSQDAFGWEWEQLSRTELQEPLFLSNSVILSADDAGDLFSLVFSVCWSICCCHAGAQSLRWGPRPQITPSLSRSSLLIQENTEHPLSSFRGWTHVGWA